VNEAIERTHRLTGMPGQEIFERGLGRSQIPIYALASATAMTPSLLDLIYGRPSNSQ
jgi:hypothetical protein